MLYPFRAASCPKLNEIAKETLDYTGATYPHISELIDKNNSHNHIQRLITTFLDVNYLHIFFLSFNEI